MPSLPAACANPSSPVLNPMAARYLPRIMTFVSSYANVRTNVPAGTLVDKLPVALEHLPVFHHKLHVAQSLDIGQRISGNGDDVGVGARRYHSDLALRFEHLRRARGRASDHVHWRHAQLYHAGKLLSDRLGPRDSADVGAEDNLHPGFQGFAKRFFMRRGAQSIALPCVAVGGSPVGVINAQCRTVPGALLHHLRDLGIGHLQTVLDRVAAPIERALQADPTVGVASDLPA